MREALRVLRHESELGSWELVRRAPAAHLRALVHDYEGYVESGRASQVLRQQVPSPRIPLIMNFGAPWEVAAEDAAAQRYDSFLAGLGERSSYVAAAGPASCVQANLTPLGAFMFLGMPMRDLANEIVPLEDVLPSAAGHLVDRLQEAQSWEARFELLDMILAKGLSDAPAPSPDVVWAWSVLERTQGKAPIGWICDRLGRSRRHLAVRFREQVGLPPKTVARIFRFERAVSLLARPDSELAAVAFACGYYDQAHLNRDFCDFAGTSPGAFARKIVPDGGVIL